MESIEKGLKVPKWVLIVRPKNTPNDPKFMGPICLRKPKSLRYHWKKAPLGVRSPCLLYEACTDIMLAKNKSFLNSEHTQNNCKKAKCKTTFGTRDVQCPKLHYLTTYEISHAQWGMILLWCFDLINYYWKFAYSSGALFIYMGKIGQCAGTL